MGLTMELSVSCKDLFMPMEHIHSTLLSIQTLDKDVMLNLIKQWIIFFMDSKGLVAHPRKYDLIRLGCSTFHLYFY